MFGIIKSEKAIVIALFAIAILYPLNDRIIISTISTSIFFVIIFLVILYTAINVAKHAEMLAKKYGEPYGTMILTLAPSS